ncbi:MAG: DegT/DnrJ/EryC1/StrS family aminotransferase [Alphaproteobacteria bacterium]|nr:DegT/DnrJ/EryC1/StrS family aminotransferase [Alphaproteobacteria bacterium]
MTADRPFIPFGKPMIDQAAKQAVLDVLDSGVLVHGGVTPDFEAAFAERVGVKHAVAVSSCTSGLYLAMFCKGIGPGDAVAAPAMTHVATAHAIELLGARPVFVDVEPGTGNMNPDGLAAAVDREPALRAAIPVHYLGLPCDMTRLQAIAEAAGIWLLEDCALAMDARHGERKAGGLGLAGAFSFYPVKHMTSIEGGMATTDDDELAFEMRRRRAFGYNRMLGDRTRPGLYDVDCLGGNFRMSEVEAAVGLAQLARLDAFQADRARNDAILRTALADQPALHVFPNKAGESISSHYCFNIILPKDGSIDRARMQDGLKAHGIGTSIHYPGAVPLFTYYKERYGAQFGDYPVAEWLGDQTISLPIGPHVSEDDAHHIAQSVIAVLQTS